MEPNQDRPDRPPRKTMDNPWIYLAVLIVAGVAVAVFTRYIDGPDNDDDVADQTTTSETVTSTTSPDTTSTATQSSATTSVSTTTSSPVVRLPVPDVSDEDDPVSALELAGFRVIEMLARHSTSQPAGGLIEQDPPAGTVVDPGTEVAVVLSLGVERCSGGSATGPPSDAVGVSGDFDGNGATDDFYLYDLGIPLGWRALVILDYGYAAETILESEFALRNEALGAHDVDMDGDQEGIAIVDAGAAIDIIGFFTFADCGLRRVDGGFFSVGGAGFEADAVVCGPPPIVTTFTVGLSSSTRTIIEYQLEGDQFLEIDRRSGQVSGDVGDSPLLCGDITYSP